MKYHTIKSERWNLRANGAYATYPIYNHDAIKLGNIECYADDINARLKRADKLGTLEGSGFYATKNQEGN